MKMILRGRRGEKTTKLLAYMHEHPTSRMICFNFRRADHLLQEARRAYPTDTWHGRFIPAETVRERLYGWKGDLLVDNAELVLAAMLGRAPACEVGRLLDGLAGARDVQPRSRMVDTVMDPNTPNRIAEEYEAKLAAVKQHFETIVRDLHADCRKEIHSVYDEQARIMLRRTTIKQVIQGEKVLQVVHVEAAEDGLVVYVR